MTIQSVAAFAQRLSELDPNGDYFTVECHELIEQVDPALSGRLCEPILAYFEAHPLKYFGVPGPLVHLVESGYPSGLPQLCHSISQRPTLTTLWMAQRLLRSDIDPIERKRLRRALASAATLPYVASEVKNEIDELRRRIDA